MIKPIAFQPRDFIPASDTRLLKMVESEDLTGSALVDNLILLRLVSTFNVQKILREKYSLSFAWLKTDPTPPAFKSVASKHNVLIECNSDQPGVDTPVEVIVYIPLGTEVDDALLLIDIPSFPIKYRFIADCNYNILKTKLPSNLLSSMVADFRPLFVFRRLISQCIDSTATNMKLASRYNSSKLPEHVINYRIQKRIVPSQFSIDFDMMQKIIHAVIGKLTPASVMDVDTNTGVTTEIRDLFGDGTCDIRVTGMRTDAGYFVDFTIQTTNTTTKNIAELGFPKDDVDVIRSIARRRTGLTLVTGEQRSGKNTTIFAMLNEIVNEPINIIEYSNPIENHMPFTQVNYRGDVELLKHYMRMVKKQDCDIAVLNEIPNSEVAFAVRDLVNSAICVITTTHIDRLWHLPYKLREFFGEDYKTILSQLNAVLNHKMFRTWEGPGLQKRILIKEHGDFEMFCYQAGVRQYFVPEDATKMKYSLQPLTEILIMTDPIKSAMLNFDEIWR